tara:strand:- start:350 stop:1120 length:771 start_codon:yes stop_codon:yes gene_type:complete
MTDYKKKFINKNKLAFVIGGSGRIGCEVLLALKSTGCKVVNLDIKFRNKQKDIINYYFDCSDTENLDKNYLNATKKFNVPNIFVNCSYPRSTDWKDNSFKKIKFKSYKENINIHLNSFIWLAKLTADRMVKKKINGSIIQLSSIYGVNAQDRNIYKNTNMQESLTYSVIKGGINNFTRQMAAFYGKYGIRVNSICPGGIQEKSHPKEFSKNYKERVPLGRFCKSDDVASTVLFLSCDASSYITGSTIMLDGGWSII